MQEKTARSLVAFGSPGPSPFWQQEVDATSSEEAKLGRRRDHAKPLLSQPPIFDYEEFMDYKVPSDRRLKRLFPRSPEWRTRLGDATVEWELLQHYGESVHDVRRHLHQKPGKEPGREKFYKDLGREIGFDLDDIEFPTFVMGEALEKGVISPLDRWEYFHLDDDGGTRRLEASLSTHDEVFITDSDGEARKKYRHLIPAGYFRAIRYYDWGGGRDSESEFEELDEEEEFAASCPPVEAKMLSPPAVNEDLSEHRPGRPIQSAAETAFQSEIISSDAALPVQLPPHEAAPFNSEDGAQAEQEPLLSTSSGTTSPHLSASAESLFKSLRRHSLSFALKLILSVVFGFLFGFGVALAATLWRHSGV